MSSSLSIKISNGFEALTREVYWATNKGYGRLALNGALAISVSSCLSALIFNPVCLVGLALAFGFSMICATIGDDLSYGIPTRFSRFISKKELVKLEKTFFSSEKLCRLYEAVETYNAEAERFEQTISGGDFQILRDDIQDILNIRRKILEARKEELEKSLRIFTEEAYAHRLLQETDASLSCDAPIPAEVIDVGEEDIRRAHAKARADAEVIKMLA